MRNTRLLRFAASRCGWIGVLFFIAGVLAPVARAQVTPLGGPGERRSSQAEMLWDEDYGAGRLTEPGRSRTLPRPNPTESTEGRPVSFESRPPNNAQSQFEAARQPAADDAWWKEDAEKTISNPARQAAEGARNQRGELIQSSQILSWVGNEPILAGDLLGRINEALQPMKDQMSPEMLDQQRMMLMEQMLPSAIEAKMVYLDFIRRLEAAQVAAIRQGVYEQFDENQLPKLVEQAQLKTPAEYERRLRELNTSIESVRRGFYEQVAAREMIRRNTKDDREVTHDDLLAYYQEHLDEYRFSAKAKWEQLMVRFDNFPSERDAYRAIAEMGNAVLKGANFASVARERSQGPTAASGGVYDWTTQGSLVSKVLDKAIFSIPTGEMSEILRDEDGFHIVRVSERQPAGKKPFVEAQVEIRDKIKEQRRDEQVKKYLERLRRETYVWNYFDQGSVTAERREAALER